MSNKSVSTGGVGFFGLLAILFIGLKLCNVIDWAWWIVLLPITIPLVITLVVLTLVIIYAISIHKSYHKIK